MIVPDFNVYEWSLGWGFTEASSVHQLIWMIGLGQTKVFEVLLKTDYKEQVNIRINKCIIKKNKWYLGSSDQLYYTICL